METNLFGINDKAANQKSLAKKRLASLARLVTDEFIRLSARLRMQFQASELCANIGASFTLLTGPFLANQRRW